MRPAHLNPRNLPGLISHSSFTFVSKELLFLCLSFLRYKARVLSKISEPLALLIFLSLSLFDQTLLCPSHDSQVIHPETRGCPRLAFAQNTSAVPYCPQVQFPQPSICGPLRPGPCGFLSCHFLLSPAFKPYWTT